MNNKKFSRLLAGVLAGTMVLGMSVTAFAAEGDPAESGNITGGGTFEGHVEKSVLSVQLPTNLAATTFEYTMDPEGLIAATEGAKDAEATFEPGANVYFLSADKTYTKDSAKLKVTNKGTADADVTITAETAANTNVTMAASSTFTGTDAELYLGLKVADKDAVAVKATGDATPASVTVGLYGNEDNFNVTYDESTKKYGYEAKTGVPDTAWNSFEFGLTGACNANGDWSEESLAASDVTVTWSYVAHDTTKTDIMLDKNATDDILVTDGSNDVVIHYSGAKPTSITLTPITDSGDAINLAVPTDSVFTVTDDTVTFKASWLASVASKAGKLGPGQYKVTINGTDYTMTVNAPAAP